MAIIVLQGADFSANNIGKIDIFQGFSATTKAVFSRIGIVEDETNQMQLAVNSFINSLVAAGIWGNGKITALCLPFLANLTTNPTLAKAVKNVIVDNDDFFASSYTSLSLTGNGLQPISGSPIAGIPYYSANRGTWQNFHYANYYLSPITNMPVSGVDVYSADFRPNLVCINETNNAFFMTGSNRAYMDGNYQYQPAMRIVCYKSDLNNGRGVAYCNGQKVLSINSDVNSDLGNIASIGFGGYEAVYGNERNYLNVPSAIISVGGYLSDSEAEVYTNAANALVEAIRMYMN